MLRTLIAVLFLLSCTDENATRDTLRKAGFTDVETTGYAWFACSDDDYFKTSFRARNARGEVVEGAVCCGWFKNCTVRF